MILAPVKKLELFEEGMILGTKYSFMWFIIIWWIFLGNEIQILLELLLFVFHENIGVAR